MAVGSLYALELDFLNGCSQALAATPGGALARSYISPGAPAFDCEQLTVHTAGPSVLNTGPTGGLIEMHRGRPVGIVYMVTLTATVIRCVPVSGPRLPSIAQMQAAAEKQAADVWAIWNYIQTNVRNNTLFPSNGNVREVAVAPTSSLVTSGGFGGWEISLDVQLNGYEELGA